MIDAKKVKRGLSCTGSKAENCNDCQYIEAIGFNQFRCNWQSMIKDALDLIEELEERIAIMKEGR